jgi:hypothetical protein
MSRVHFRVRPRDSNDGWVVDRYDGRGAWTMTEGLEHRWSLAEARRQASKLTRLIVNDGFNRPPVNKTVRCEHRHYDGRQCGHRVTGEDGPLCGHHKFCPECGGGIAHCGGQHP